MKFERGLDPKRAMNIGDLALRKKEEQEAATREVENTLFEEMGASQAFHFFEEKLGKVHWAVIEFRKTEMCKLRDKRIAASKRFEESGALDELVKRI